MQMHIDEEKRLVCVWLNREEQETQTVDMQLQALFAAYKPRKYRVCVFYSGYEDLQDALMDLLRYNRKKLEQACMEKEALPVSCLGIT